MCHSEAYVICKYLNEFTLLYSPARTCSGLVG